MNSTRQAQDFEVARTVVKVLVTVPLAVLAAYAARQSNAHRSEAIEARRLQLDIAALDPYIELLPEEVRVDLKVEMARRVFGRRPKRSKHDEIPPSLADELVAAVKTAIKSE